MALLKPTQPEPFPPEVMEALRSAEVQWGEDDEESERLAIEHEDELPYIPFGTELYDATGHFWDLLSEAERKRLTSSETKYRCYFCNGINHHRDDCVGQPYMPWGKHKGQPLSAVPERYLVWAFRESHCKPHDKRTILAELQRRFVKYRAPEWEQMLEADNAIGYSKERDASGLSPRDASDHNHPLN